MMTNTENPAVLIVGAGPTGLVLALWLTRIGVKVRIIDKAKEAGTTSRAVVVHARTLEFYRQLGIAEDLISRGLKFPRVNLWVAKKRRAHIDLGEMGKGRSRYPYVLIFPQDEHEKFLVEELAKWKVAVERSTELTAYQEMGPEIKARIKTADGKTEEAFFQYLAGCDGAHSVVREQLGVGFPGDKFPGKFYVADIEGTGPALNQELHVSLDKADFFAIFPLKGDGRGRLIGDIHWPDGQDDLKWKDVEQRPLSEMELSISKVNWFSTYNVHHRVASHFQKSNVFILGDAAHIHSPVGGQGMNTGIGDAVNLAWKLGAVLKQGAHPKIIDTYEPERIAFARKLVQTVDRAFQFVTSKSFFARVVRMYFVPLVVPLAVRFESVRRLAFATVSQTGIRYPDSALSVGSTAGVDPGDRLPWIELVDNFAPLNSLDWQVHIYGATAGDEFKVPVPVHVFPWNNEMEEKDLVRGAAYLVRPDGHIATISARKSADEILAYFRNLSAHPNP